MTSSLALPYDINCWLPTHVITKHRSKQLLVGSGCGSVGRVVASDTKGPQFESSYRQKFIFNIYLLFIINCIEIRGREWPTLQKQLLAETKRLRSSQLMPNNCCYYLIISNCTIGTCFKAFVLAQKFYFSFSIRLKHIQAAWAETDRIGFLDLILQPWARSYKENDIVTYCFAQM